MASRKKVAVLAIEGKIGGSSAGIDGIKKGFSQLELLRKLKEVEKDKTIAGLILRIDSPGGAASDSEEIYQAVADVDKVKPVFVSIGNMCCSGGYMIACGARRIYANNTSLVGSIGVIMQIPNITKLADKIGINMNTIKAGDMKDIGNPFREMTEEEKEYLRVAAENINFIFKGIVADSRLGRVESDKTYKFTQMQDGRFFNASEALKYGFIDEISSFNDVVYEMGRTLAVDDNSIKLVYIKKKRGVINSLLGLTSGIISGGIKDAVCGLEDTIRFR